MTDREKLEPLSNVPVEVTVVLGQTRLTIGQLLALEEGAVLELDRGVNDEVGRLRQRQRGGQRRTDGRKRPAGHCRDKSFGRGKRMRIKKFVDEDMIRLMRRVKEELGPEAVIVSTSQSEDGRSELVAAVETDEIEFADGAEPAVYAAAYSDNLIRERLDYHEADAAVRARLLALCREEAAAGGEKDDVRILTAVFNRLFAAYDLLDRKNPVKVFAGLQGSGKTRRFGQNRGACLPQRHCLHADQRRRRTCRRQCSVEVPGGRFVGGFSGRSEPEQLAAAGSRCGKRPFGAG